MDVLGDPETNFTYLYYTIGEDKAEDHTWRDEIFTMILGVSKINIFFFKNMPLRWRCHALKSEM